MSDSLYRIGPSALGASALTQYTVPASTQATLRYIHVANETGTTRTFTLSIGTDGAGKRLFKDVEVAAGDAFSCDLNVTLEAAEIIQAYASAAAALTLTIGMVLTV